MARREPDRLVYDDRMIHCCLYFIAPHRLKHIDLAFMRALHRKVNIAELSNPPRTFRKPSWHLR